MRWLAGPPERIVGTAVAQPSLPPARIGDPIVLTPVFVPGADRGLLPDPDRQLATAAKRQAKAERRAARRSQ